MKVNCNADLGKLYRLSGLVDFASYCGSEYDTRVMRVNLELSLSSWLSPLCILILYHLLAYQVKILLTTKPRPVSIIVLTISSLLIT
jgi:hypothetical protein